MIRATTRLGLVSAGAGGSAYDYAFDATGLSDDWRLAPSLENLTHEQLQNALDGKDPAPDLAALLYADVTGTGPGSLPCGQPGKPCGPPSAGVPTWVIITGAVVAGAIVLGSARR